MKKHLLPWTLAIGAGLATTPVQAQDLASQISNNLYVSAFIGGNFLRDIVTNTDYSTNTSTYRETYRQKPGVSFRAAIGTQVRENIRGEFEFGVHTSNQGAIMELANGTTLTQYGGKGEITTYTGLLNIWADLDIPNNTTGLTPYVGGGVGLAVVDTKLVYTGFPTYGPQDRSVEFAGQVGTGVNWALSEKVDVGVGYRLNFINSPTTSQVTTGGGEVSTYDFESLFSHSVGISLKVKLN